MLGICKTNHPFWNRRTTQTLDSQTRLFTMPFFEDKQNSENNHTMWQLSFIEPSEEESIRFSKFSCEELKQLALKKCGTWHNPIPELLTNTEPNEVTGYPMYDRPSVTFEEFRGNYQPDSLVTMLGDAQHPMSAFKGQGANQTMVDAISLAKILVEEEEEEEGVVKGNKKRISWKLAKFEKEMIERGGNKVELSREAAQFLHSPLALHPANTVRSLSSHESLKEKPIPPMIQKNYDRIISQVQSFVHSASPSPSASPLIENGNT